MTQSTEQNIDLADPGRPTTSSRPSWRTSRARPRQEIIERISAARDEGDLKENGGYHAAREEQGKIEARIRQLEDMLSAPRSARPRPTTASSSPAWS